MGICAAFQMKHYLWGVFKPRKVEGKQDAALHHPDCTTGATAFTANDTATGIATDAACMPQGAFGVATVSIPTEDATNALSYLQQIMDRWTHQSWVHPPAG